MKNNNILTKTLVLGIGNVLFGDEGLGVHLASLLRHNYRFANGPGAAHPATLGPAHFSIVDGGTLGPHLIPLLAEQSQVLLLDTITSTGSKPGEVFCFDYLEMPAPVKAQGSAHEVEMRQTLAMMRMAGDLPRIMVLAAVPAIISAASFELSPPIQAAAGLMEDKALKILAGWGFQGERVAALTISDIAANCCRVGDRVS